MAKHNEFASIYYKQFYLYNNTFSTVAWNCLDCWLVGWWWWEQRQIVRTWVVGGLCLAISRAPSVHRNAWSSVSSCCSFGGSGRNNWTNGGVCTQLCRPGWDMDGMYLIISLPAKRWETAFFCCKLWNARQKICTSSEESRPFLSVFLVGRRHPLQAPWWSWWWIGDRCYN